MLYDIGMEPSMVDVPARPKVIPPAKYPPLKEPHPLPKLACYTPLPLRESSPPSVFLHAAAAHTAIPSRIPLTVRSPPSTKPTLDHEMLANHDISSNDMQMVYLSPSPFHDAFEEAFQLRRFDPTRHPTAGLVLEEKNGKLYLRDISPSTPAAKIRAWRSRVRGACLMEINGVPVTYLDEVKGMFLSLGTTSTTTCTLLLAHSAIKDGLVETGIPQVNVDQLNNRWSFEDIEALTQDQFDRWFASIPPHFYVILEHGGVKNFTTASHKLTRRKLLQQDDWADWQNSEYLQLDQYSKQFMFGMPCAVTKKDAVFNLIWTYLVKPGSGVKKARCTCDGSTRAGQVRVMDHTFANSVDQTASRIFYGIAAAENLLVFGADVSNAFGEAPPPKQGFFIRPDRAFREWWVARGHKPIPEGFVIPVLAAMQGHPESPRLWEKHIDKILRDYLFVPTVHEPCLYRGTVDGERVIFKRQVDDFAIATTSEHIANIIFDAIDSKLSMPIKRQGLLNLYNGIDILQSRWYIKLSMKTYLTKMLAPYFDTWLDVPTTAMPTPLGSSESFVRRLYEAVGDPDPKVQTALEKTMGIKYRKAIGELIWPMVTCRPDLSQAVVKCSQASACPSEIHFKAVRSIIRFVAATIDDGIYFWRVEPRLDFPDDPLPTISSSPHDIRMLSRPHDDPLLTHGYMDSSWADCLLTRRSFGGVCMRLAGGPAAYKSRLWPTVALSSTEAEYMVANDAGRMSLYMRSILWDLGVPQEAATILYEDNDGATAMANAGKPTPRRPSGMV